MAGYITFTAMCGWPSQFSSIDREAGVSEHKVRYCNQVAGHVGAHEHLPADDPRTYQSKIEKVNSDG